MACIGQDRAIDGDVTDHGATTPYWVDEDFMGWTTVHVAYSRPDAEVIGAVLRGCGIEVLVVADYAGGTGPELAFSNGVEVRVRDEEASRAMAALATDSPRKG